MQKIKQGLTPFFRWIFREWDSFVILFLTASLILGGFWLGQRYMTPQEAKLRQSVVETAESYLGYKEADGSHKVIIDLYNAHFPRARGYEVTYEDSWCATFCSAVAIKLGLTERIPLECSCGKLIELFEAQGRWTEEDWYLPKAGDYILYDWDYTKNGDSTGWPDHVGIVVKTIGPLIQVIEGNKEDDVSYRYLFVNDPSIRGYGRPNYQ